MARGDVAHRFEVAHRDRLPAAGIVGHRDHDQRDAILALGRDQFFQARDIEVALEIQPRLRVGGFRYRQVNGARAGKFDVGARGIEVRIVGHHVPGPAHHREQDALGRAALMGGNHVAEAGQLLHHTLHSEEALAAGVGFVPAHHRRPLLGGHRGGARIGEQVDEHSVARSANRLYPACLISSSRSSGVVWRKGSTLLMRNGSMMVFMALPRAPLNQDRYHPTGSAPADQAACPA